MKRLQAARLGIALLFPILCAVGTTDGQQGKNQDDTNWTTDYQTYVVRNGDTIKSISKMWGVSMAELRQVNALADNTEPTVGAKIQIPMPLDIGPPSTNEMRIRPCPTFGCLGIRS